VKFRYYLKFHGARTAFGRVIEGKITSAGHRTVPGRHSAGIFTHRTGTGRFLFNIYIVRFQFRLRCPAWHRTMSDKRQEISKIALQIERCPSGTRPMFYESNFHRWEATCFCRRTYCIYIDIVLLKTKKHKYKNIFRLSSRTSAIEIFFAVLSKCVFHHHCQRQPQSFLF